MKFLSKNRKIPPLDNKRNRNILNELKTRAVFFQLTTIEANRHDVVTELIDPDSSKLLWNVSQQKIQTPASCYEMSANRISRLQQAVMECQPTEYPNSSKLLWNGSQQKNRKRGDQ
jgi:hypothetical protein